MRHAHLTRISAPATVAEVEVDIMPYFRCYLQDDAPRSIDIGHPPDEQLMFTSIIGRFRCVCRSAFARRCVLFGS